VRSAGPVLSHFGKISFPEALPKKMRKALNLLDAKNFRQGEVDGGGICFHP
jgi:hypothetical protein